MKKIALMLLAVLMVASIAAGCKPNVPTPSPSPKLSPTAPMTTPAMTPAATFTPDNSPMLSPGLSASPDLSASPGLGNGENGGQNGNAAGGKIEGFEEGKVVKEEDVPDIVKAVKDKYPDAKITSITMETYEDKQCYHVLLEEAVEGNKDLMVSADGVVTPVTSKAD